MSAEQQDLGRLIRTETDTCGDTFVRRRHYVYERTDGTHTRVTYRAGRIARQVSYMPRARA